MLLFAYMGNWEFYIAMVDPDLDLLDLIHVDSKLRIGTCNKELGDVVWY